MKRYQDFKTVKVDKAELEKEASRPVLNKNCVSSPVIIESIELLYNYGLYFVRTISKDGYEGISVASSRAKYLYPILEQLVIPYFVGKDARDLDELIDGVYVYKSNYKLTGLALWLCVLGRGEHFRYAGEDREKIGWKASWRKNQRSCIYICC
jgi:hypothetical protein